MDGLHCGYLIITLPLPAAGWRNFPKAACANLMCMVWNCGASIAGGALYTYCNRSWRAPGSAW